MAGVEGPEGCRSAQEPMYEAEGRMVVGARTGEWCGGRAVGVGIAAEGGGCGVVCCCVCLALRCWSSEGFVGIVLQSSYRKRKRKLKRVALVAGM